MTIIFFIKSKTINIDKYNIKDIPGSSGRFDVISRCILAALLGNDNFDKNIQIWIFLDHYGTFIFSPEFFNYEIFPKNELRFTDYFVKFLQEYHNTREQSLNPLSSIRESNMNIIEAINHFKKLNFNLYILCEQGQDLFKLLRNIQEKGNNVFIIGSQEDEYLYSKELLALKIPMISIGNQSYLASTVIRLLKLHILAL
jgi:tRNA (pseudouridine54-N1)-methyltransferase